MGNNDAYTTFQHTIITLYNYDKLDAALLKELAEQYAGTDIDSGGDTGLTARDGKTLEEVCILTTDPTWVPVKNKDETVYGDDPDEWEYYERYSKWEEVQGGWGW